jgi:hypothetical protein
MKMQNFKINNVTLPALPGNLRLVPDFNTYGPFLDGRHYSTGTVRSRKNTFVGYYANSNGNITVKI